MNTPSASASASASAARPSSPSSESRVSLEGRKRPRTPDRDGEDERQVPRKRHHFAATHDRRSRSRSPSSLASSSSASAKRVVISSAAAAGEPELDLTSVLLNNSNNININNAGDSHAAAHHTHHNDDDDDAKSHLTSSSSMKPEEEDDHHEDEDEDLDDDDDDDDGLPVVFEPPRPISRGPSPARAPTPSLPASRMSSAINDDDDDAASGVSGVSAATPPRAPLKLAHKAEKKPVHTQHTLPAPKSRKQQAFSPADEDDDGTEEEDNSNIHKAFVRMPLVPQRAASPSASASASASPKKKKASSSSRKKASHDDDGDDVVDIVDIVDIYSDVDADVDAHAGSDADRLSSLLDEMVDVDAASELGGEGEGDFDDDEGEGEGESGSEDHDSMDVDAELLGELVGSSHSKSASSKLPAARKSPKLPPVAATPGKKQQRKRAAPKAPAECLEVLRHAVASKFELPEESAVRRRVVSLDDIVAPAGTSAVAASSAKDSGATGAMALLSTTRSVLTDWMKMGERFNALFKRDAVLHKKETSPDKYDADVKALNEKVEQLRAIEDAIKSKPPVERAEVSAAKAKVEEAKAAAEAARKATEEANQALAKHNEGIKKLKRILRTQADLPDEKRNRIKKTIKSHESGDTLGGLEDKVRAAVARENRAAEALKKAEQTRADLLARRNLPSKAAALTAQIRASDSKVNVSPIDQTSWARYLKQQTTAFARERIGPNAPYSALAPDAAADLWTLFAVAPDTLDPFCRMVVPPPNGIEPPHRGTQYTERKALLSAVAATVLALYIRAAGIGGNGSFLDNLERAGQEFATTTVKRIRIRNSSS